MDSNTRKLYFIVFEHSFHCLITLESIFKHALVEQNSIGRVKFVQNSANFYLGSQQIDENHHFSGML